MPLPAEPDAGPTRVVVAHRAAAGRLALRMLVENEDGLEVVAEVAAAPEAGRQARARQADFLVLHDGLLADGSPGLLPASCLLVVLGLESHPAAAATAKALGARHYVLWDCAGDDLPPLLLGAAAQPLPVAGV